jgi:hypothetical protein
MRTVYVRSKNGKVYGPYYYDDDGNKTSGGGGGSKSKGKIGTAVDKVSGLARGAASIVRDTVSIGANVRRGIELSADIGVGVKNYKQTLKIKKNELKIKGKETKQELRDLPQTLKLKKLQTQETINKTRIRVHETKQILKDLQSGKVKLNREKYTGGTSDRDLSGNFNK